MKYKLEIEYNGSNFVGWQKQNSGPSIQQALEEAIKNFSNESVAVHGSSRTDSGVHALCQVAHLNLKKSFNSHTVKNAINFYLKRFPITVTDLVEVNDDFHARFSSIKRYYKYRIINRNSKLALEIDRAWWVCRKLDLEKMRAAAQELVGKHDFTSFRSTACQAKNPLRTIDEIKINKVGELIEIDVCAQSFLHSQVRIIVGTLKEIGEGKILDIKEILAAKDRRAAGPTAPACGLYLMKVVTPTGLEPVLPP